jgi:Protein of unknown function (DUF1553)
MRCPSGIKRRTPLFISNFGTLGEKLTHLELLDWLAADFMEHGWSLKRLHRQNKKFDCHSEPA